jgi:hypothetical protein
VADGEARGEHEGEGEGGEFRFHGIRIGGVGVWMREGKMDEGERSGRFSGRRRH